MSALLPRREREELKYVYLEKELQGINSEYIVLNDIEKRRNNVILSEVLREIVYKMRKNKLFDTMYRKEYYGGSYYDNLKVGKPNEYDLDLLLDLPKNAKPVLETSDMPGFVQIRLENMTGFMKTEYADEFPNLANKLLDDYHYLSTSKVSSWIESVLTVAVNQFYSLSANYPHVKQINTCIFHFTVHKAGPAFTLKLYGKVDNKIVLMDIDLVPCFVLTSNNWPTYPYRENPVPSKSEFFVVPKKLANDGFRNISRYWRLSFQEQEGVLIENLQNLKPALRLLKTLRDSCDFPIASYYLKTIFLWKVEQKSMNWQHPLSYVFMEMLKICQEYLEAGDIPYFWNWNNNLISQVNSHKMANRLRKIINVIERNPDDPTRITKYFGGRVPEFAEHYFWSQIKDLPDNELEVPHNEPHDSQCTIL